MVKINHLIALTSTSEKVSMNLVYKSSKVLLQEARMNGPPTKTLVEKYYSKRSGFHGKLKCPIEVS